MTRKKMACVTTLGMTVTFLSEPGGMTTELLLPPGESTMVQAFDGKFEVIDVEPICQLCKYYIGDQCHAGGGKKAPNTRCNLSKSKDKFEQVFEPGSHISKAKVMEKDDYEKYDALLFNVSPALMPHVVKVREQIGYGSSTQLFGNMDHGLGIASQHFNSYPALRDTLNQLDMIFSVEPEQRSFVKRMLPMREIHDIPHCMDVERHRIVGDMFKEQRAQNDPKSIGISYHEYEHPILIPLASINDPRLADTKPILCGYDFSCQTCMRRNGCPNAQGNGFVCDQYAIGFDGFGEGLKRKPYPTHMKELSQSINLGYESFQYASISRYGMQWAAMGIPAFVPKNCRSHNLFDYEPTDPKNFKQIGNILARLHRDDTYAEQISETAFQRCVDEHSFKSVREKVVEALEKEESRK